MAFLGFMHMKSDALKRLYPRCKEKKVARKGNEQIGKQNFKQVIFLLFDEYTYPTKPKQWS